MLIVTRAFYDWLGYAVIMGGSNHSVAEFEGTSGDHLVSHPAQSRVRRLLSAVSSHVLNISTDGDSTASLDSLFH